MRHLWIVLVIFVLFTSFYIYPDGCKLEKEGKEIILENDFIKVVVRPDLGGTIVKFIHKKSGINYTREPPAGVWPGQGAGLLVDRFWGQTQIRGENYETAVYSYKVIKDTPEEVILSLWHKPSWGPARGILVEKNLFLSKDNSGLSVRYRIKNERISKGAAEIDNFIKLSSIFSSTSGNSSGFIQLILNSIFSLFI